jgi:hypothetical protein
MPLTRTDTHDQPKTIQYYTISAIVSSKKSPKHCTKKEITKID